MYMYLIITGVEVDIPNEGKCIVRGQLLCAIMDLPAKAAILNCIQYNGRYGCSRCKHPGCVVSIIYHAVDVNLQLLYVHKDMGLLSIYSLCHLPISVHEYPCDFLLQVKVGRGHARAYDYRQTGSRCK